jgi:ankyrin repeat protein
MLPTDIMQNELICFLSFSDSISLRKTSKFFNTSFTYNHDPRIDNQRAIILAVDNCNAKGNYNGKIDAIKCLLNVEYADPSIYNNYPIRMAILYGNLEVVRALLDSGKVHPSINYNYPLLAASRTGNLELVTLFLDYPNFKLDNVNVTLALSEALALYYDDIGRLILSRIPLTDGDFIMTRLSYFSEEGAAMIINDGNIALI